MNNQNDATGANQGRRSFFPGGANFKKRALFVKKALQQKSFIATMSQSN